MLLFLAGQLRPQEAPGLAGGHRPVLGELRGQRRAARPAVRRGVLAAHGRAAAARAAASSRPRPTRRRCSSSCGSSRSTSCRWWSSACCSCSCSADRISPDLTLDRSLDAIFSGLIGLPGSYEFQSEFIERVFRMSMFGLGVVGLVVALALLFRPIVAHPQQDEDALGARQPPGAHLRLRHAGLLRPARRQELLLLLRRRGDDRLHLHRSLRPGLGRPDRSTRVARAGGRRVPRHVPPAGVGRGVPRRARVAPRPLRRPGPAHLLPGRRGRRASAPTSASRARSGRACASPRPASSAPTASST